MFKYCPVLDHNENYSPTRPQLQLPTSTTGAASISGSTTSSIPLSFQRESDGDLSIDFINLERVQQVSSINCPGVVKKEGNNF